MPFKCSVPGCRSNYSDNLYFSVFQFPREESLHQEWIKAMQKEDFKCFKHSRVCELHFEPSQIIREASAFDPRTSRTLTAPLSIPRLRTGAVPSLFMPTPGTLVKRRRRPKGLANTRQKIQQEDEAVNEETEKTEESQLAKLLQTDSGTEFKNVVETSYAIEQESAQSVHGSTRLVMGKVLTAEELTSPLSSSSASASVPTFSSPYVYLLPFLDNASPTANPDSTTVDETPATHVSNKHARKRKINDAELYADGTSTDAAQDNLCSIIKLSTPSKSLPSTGTSEKSSGHTPDVAQAYMSPRPKPCPCPNHVRFSMSSKLNSTFPNINEENATRQMFESLADGSENNPLFGSRTSERPGDLFDVFADFIADKLREMDWDDCANALRVILDVVFKAGKAQKNSEVESDSSGLGADPGSSDQG